ncbi:MAG: monovalent cation/H+ antiporter subunit D family protein, partial [Candidatus Puniceispirillum sp.]|nr:monovalent cation/H+ antiporter subunit D family protein [Candidatus Puniceispirillum sp.]
MTASYLIQNLPALLVAIPLLLAAIVTLIPVPAFAWIISLAAVGASFVIALLLHSVTLTGVEISYYLGNWEPPWGIEFVVDSATSMTLAIMMGLAFVATLAARHLIPAEI